jgi:soluble lytic murein transglycosylase-like protein
MLFILAGLFPRGAYAATNADAPEWLVQAIIQTESKGNPYAVHVGGKAHYPETREEALQLIAAAVQHGENFDLGLMQINSWWIDKYAIPAESLLDPAINRQWGTAILADEIARYGLNWKAVGKYHSPDMERGRLYAWKVYWRYAGRLKERANGGQAGSQNIFDAGRTQRDSGVRP